MSCKLNGSMNYPAGYNGYQAILDSGIHENLMLAVIQGNRSVRRKALQKIAKILNQKSKPAMSIKVISIDQYIKNIGKTGGAA